MALAAPGPAGDETDAGFTRHLPPGFGHHRSPRPSCPADDRLDTVDIIEAVECGQKTLAGNRESSLHTLNGKLVGENSSTVSHVVSIPCRGIADFQRDLSRMPHDMGNAGSIPARQPAGFITMMLMGGQAADGRSSRLRPGRPLHAIGIMKLGTTGFRSTRAGL